MLRGEPIRLYPDPPNNFNPIYEDDYVELGIRAMEVAALPPITVNWGGSETVSAEEYCAYMGELVGVEPIFEYTEEAHTPLWPDVTVHARDPGSHQGPLEGGFRRMIEARHPELLPEATADGAGRSAPVDGSSGGARRFSEGGGAATGPRWRRGPSRRRCR